MKSASANRATIFEVAEAAGVSITTVSHVFSGKRRVSEGTRERVLAAAERLAYAPSAKAQALAMGRSYSLALQVSFSGEALVFNSFFAALLPAFSLAALERGYSFVYVPPDQEGREFVLPLIEERRVDGVVFVDPLVGDPFVEAVRADGLPFVSMGGRLADGSSSYWVDNDHAHICDLVATHLAERGYERPGLVTIDSDVTYVRDYLDGFTRAFASSCVIVAEQFTPRAARAAVRAALTGTEPPDALFCVHDQFALAAETAVEAEGLAVGRDVGIIGVGDSLFARQAHAPLSSVSVFPEQFGTAALEMLDALIAGGEPAAPVVIPSKLVPRASTSRA